MARTGTRELREFLYKAPARRLLCPVDMSWEQRLREMVLAGGALATAACGGSTAAQADLPSSATSNPGGDAAAPGDGGSSDDVPVNCCMNAAPDPCSDVCSGNAGDAVCTSCEQARAACLAMNGFYEIQSDGSLGCTRFGPPVDAGAGPSDAAPTDPGPTDASFSEEGCCNANPDPCCAIAYCSGGVGPDAAIYVTCEQSRAQCESMNGYYVSRPDGSLGCTPSSATGH